MKHLLLIALLAVATNCGYRPAYAGRPPSERLAVVAASNQTPVGEAVAGVLSSVKSELRAAGALREGSGYPRLVIEVLRVDEAAGGLGAGDPQAQPGPRSRSSVVGVTARGWVEVSAGADAALDTGDVRRVSQVAPGAQATVDSEGYLEAAYQAGRRAGSALARRVLGMPEPGYGPL